MPVRYAANWVPGLNDAIDRDESLQIGLEWLIAAEGVCQHRGFIFMHAKSMARNAPLLTAAARRWEFVSPRSRRPLAVGPVLAIWPPGPEEIELAEELARDTALCLIAGRYPIGAWVRKSGAKCLALGFESNIGGGRLSGDVEELLDGMLVFDGHNGFLGAGGKEEAIRALRAIAMHAARPASQTIEDYLISSGDTDADGARRARRWYEEILTGKQHRDYRGRPIW